MIFACGTFASGFSGCIPWDNRRNFSNFERALMPNVLGSDIYLGTDLFSDLRQRKGCYVDKTKFIEMLVGPNTASVSLITRPRRFGKTLLLSMLRDFFQIETDSSKLFENLDISKNKALCKTWMNSRPVVFFSLNVGEAHSFDLFLENFRQKFKRCLDNFSQIISSGKLTASQRQDLKELTTGTPNESQLRNSLFLLVQALAQYHGKTVIVLLDEYDAPLESAFRHGYYERMLAFLRDLMGSALKSNPNLCFSVVTGGLRISKESLFTGLNNFVCYGIQDGQYSDICGFTEEEVARLLKETGHAEKSDVIREWYDGYLFGDSQEIYCPWDVLNYVLRLSHNPKAEPDSYWANTTGSDPIRRLLERSDLDVSGKIEALLRGESVEATISEILTYETLEATEDNFWTLLYLSGYLTKDRTQPEVSSSANKVRLRIPNLSLLKVFRTTVAGWFKASVPKLDRDALFRALWDGDAVALTKEVRRKLYETISYFDEKEIYYHAFLAGILSMGTVKPKSNAERGSGRPDIVIEDLFNRRAVIIEIKLADRYEDLEKKAKTALRQIQERKYKDGLDPCIETVRTYGAAFNKKECLFLPMISDNR